MGETALDLKLLRKLREQKNDVATLDLIDMVEQLQKRIEELEVALKQIIDCYDNKTGDIDASYVIAIAQKALEGKDG